MYIMPPLANLAESWANVAMICHICPQFMSLVSTVIVAFNCPQAKVLNFIKKLS